MTHREPVVSGGAYDARQPGAGDGLVLESTYLWASLRATDGGGGDADIVTAMRRIAADDAWPATLLLHSNRGAGGLARLRPAPAGAAEARREAGLPDAGCVGEAHGRGRDALP